MRIINASLHRILDFLTVVGFALAPTLFGLSDIPAKLAYTLAVVHLVLTLLTRFRANGRGVVPFPVHGGIELVVAVALIIAPFLLRWQHADFRFYVSTGLIFLLVWTLTDYRGVNEPLDA